ncbi:MAG TPA: class I SAM-dependent methyltransferase [Phycisphaerales bacterium]|nr:class I SAM-dependent methyltransferase [Phycisphaerales bacterium]
MFEPNDQANALYEDPVVYDILHAPGTAEDVDALESIHTRFASGAPDTWLEPACGSGRYLRLAAKRGHRVIGFDLESSMIEYAAQRADRLGLADRSTFFVADMRTFAPYVKARSVGLAFNLINTIRHLESDDDLLRHFDQIASVLHPGGVYVVGLSLTLYGHEMPSEDVWEGARGRCKVSQFIHYTPPTDRDGDRLEQIYSHLTVSRPSGKTEIPSCYALRAYDEAQWRRAIDRSPLRVIETLDQSGHACRPEAPGYALWVLGRG